MRRYHEGRIAIERPSGEASPVDSVAEPIVILDAELRVRYLNPAAEAEFGQSLPGAGGKDYRAIIPELSEDEFARSAARVLQTQRRAVVTMPAGQAGRLFDIRLSPAAEGGLTLIFEERSTADVLPEILLLTPSEANRQPISQRWSDYTGVPAGNADEFAWIEAVHPDDRARCEDSWRQAARYGNLLETEYRLRRHDGGYHWVVTRAAAMRDEAGRVQKWCGISADIHSYKLAEQDLARSEEDFQRFAYAASHDLREPLRMIAAYSQLLVRRLTGDLDGETRQYAAFLEEGVGRLQEMIAGLLDYSRVMQTAGWPKSVMDMNVVVDLALAHLQPLLESAGACVTRDPLPCLLVNESRLMQVVQNLVTNSIKFRSAEAPHVHISSRQEGQWWVFQVRDNGMGFDMAYAERIFQVFQRLHSHAEIEGTGIGLAIVKRIVELHGGRVWAESKPGHGASFYFTLPADGDAQE